MGLDKGFYSWDLIVERAGNLLTIDIRNETENTQIDTPPNFMDL